MNDSKMCYAQWIETAERLDTSEACIHQLQRALSEDWDHYVELAENAYTGEAAEFPIYTYDPENKLVCAFLLLTKARLKYEEQEIPEQIYVDTMKDLIRLSHNYKEAHPCYGLTVDDVGWLHNHFTLQLFQIGNLQFQMYRMHYWEENNYMTFRQEDKNSLPEGSNVLSVHIPRGAKLDTELVIESMEKAAAFYEEYFPDFHWNAYICYSWLLYPGLCQILPQDSKINRFRDLFKIIAANHDSTQALERIYMNEQYQTTRKTSLQLQARKHPEALGFACGVRRT